MIAWQEDPCYWCMKDPKNYALVDCNNPCPCKNPFLRIHDGTTVIHDTGGNFTSLNTNFNQKCYPIGRRGLVSIEFIYTIAFECKKVDCLNGNIGPTSIIFNLIKKGVQDTIVDPTEYEFAKLLTECRLVQDICDTSRCKTSFKYNLSFKPEALSLKGGRVHYKEYAIGIKIDHQEHDAAEHEGGENSPTSTVDHTHWQEVPVSICASELREVSPTDPPVKNPGR